MNYGECEIQTYTLSDESKTVFILKASCIQGLILLNFQSKDQRKSAHEIAKVTGCSVKEI